MMIPTPPFDDPMRRGTVPPVPPQLPRPPIGGEAPIGQPMPQRPMGRPPAPMAPPDPYAAKRARDMAEGDRLREMRRREGGGRPPVPPMPPGPSAPPAGRGHERMREALRRSTL